MEPKRDPREAEAAAPSATAESEVERLSAAQEDVERRAEEAERRAEDAERRADEENSRAEGYLGLLKRERADFTNFRRRMEQERAEQVRAAMEDLILSLLPALDDLERALASVPPEEADAPWVQGVRLIDRSLRAALERAGIERIPAEGQRFDPKIHEALMQEDAQGRPEGEVVRELRPGYRLGDRVLRPAQVSVASGAEA
ncbi:MAG: GrpE protein [Chloroflexi bacterium]|nr:GrpE protein [Chloroflexota bacterium]